jgi:tRNA modification GTPase
MRAARRLLAQLRSAAPARSVSATSRGSGDTIFALSTPPGRAALAVVRCSGPGVRAGVLRLLPRGAALPEPRTAALVRLAEGGDALDRALLLFFPAPRSATGQDVAELHLHGGPAVVHAVLAALARTPVRPVGLPNATQSCRAARLSRMRLVMTACARGGGLLLRASLRVAPSRPACLTWRARRGWRTC